MNLRWAGGGVQAYREATVGAAPGTRVGFVATRGCELERRVSPDTERAHCSHWPFNGAASSHVEDNC